MASGDGFRKYVEAGSAFTQVTRARAEEIVHELVDAGHVQRSQAQTWVDDLVERSRNASEQFVETIRSEVVSQLSHLGVNSVDDVAKQVADILKRSASAGRSATSNAAGRAAATASRASKAAKSATKRSAKKSPAKKVAKKAPVKKAAAKKAPVKKAPAKKAPAKKAAAKKAPAKKTAAKKSR
jgi:polyhydroxyalkanoate synthesis regulator phasin